MITGFRRVKRAIEIMIEFFTKKTRAIWDDRDDPKKTLGFEVTYASQCKATYITHEVRFTIELDPPHDYGVLNQAWLTQEIENIVKKRNYKTLLSSKYDA